MCPKVVQVIPMEDYSVYVYFEDGKIVCYNVAHLLNKGIFYALTDIDVFMSTCTVLNDTLAWDLEGKRDSYNCLDIDPDVLYELPFVNEQIA